jgi:hypothetical protein
MMKQTTSIKLVQLLRPFVFVIALFFGGGSVATVGGSNIEKADYIQSQKCTGALSIMTSIGLMGETLPSYKYFSDLADFQSFIFQYYVSERIENSVMGDVRLAVSRGVVLVDDEAINDPNSLQATVKHCLSWLSEVKLHFAAQDASAPASKVMETMPRPSNYYEYPFPDWTPMIPITESAYELWVGAGLRDVHRCISTGHNQTIDCYSQEKE